MRSIPARLVPTAPTQRAPAGPGPTTDRPHYLRLRDFTPGDYRRGRSLAWQVAWFATLHLAFRKWWFPRSWRPSVLRVFGARVGRRCNIKHDVRVLWPWRLVVGDDVWIGEGAHLYNMEQVEIGDDSCISQDVMVCTGSHDRRQASLPYKLAPITVEPGSWVCLRATLLPGAVVRSGSVIPAGTVLGPHDRQDVRVGPPS